MSGASLNRLVKLCAASILICAIECLFVAGTALTAIDETTHWPVEVTEHFNSVYGEVRDISLEDGDSVGMFDAEGNCYGAGLVRDGYYFLSAFRWEEADATKPDDFTIQGFKEGQTVIFKAYEVSTGQEYILVPASGSYSYRFQDEHPPVRIDLVYRDDVQPPLPDEEPLPDVGPLPDEEPLRYYGGGGGGVILQPTEQAEEDELDKQDVLAKKPEETLPQEKEDVEIKEDKGKQYETEPYEEYKGREPLTRERIPRPRKDRAPRYQEGEKEPLKEGEVVLAEAPAAEPLAVKEEPKEAKKPLPTKIILIFAILILVIAALLKKFKIL